MFVKKLDIFELIKSCIFLIKIYYVNIFLFIKIKKKNVIGMIMKIL